MLDGEEGRQGACWLDAKGNKGLLFRSVWREGQSHSPRTEGVGTGLSGVKAVGRIQSLSQLSDGPWEPEGGVAAHG